jgi:hypothetical protein
MRAHPSVRVKAWWPAASLPDPALSRRRLMPGRQHGENAMRRDDLPARARRCPPTRGRSANDTVRAHACGYPTCIWARRAARPQRCWTSCARVDCETLFLVGDIIDGWQLRRSWYWPQAHNDVVQKAAAQGTQGHQGDIRSGQPRRVRAQVSGPQLRWRGRGGRVHPRPRRRPQAVDHAWRLFRRRHPVRQVAGLRGRLGLRAHPARQPSLQFAARAHRPAVLEPEQVPQAEGQACSQLCG